MLLFVIFLCRFSYIKKVFSLHYTIDRLNYFANIWHIMFTTKYAKKKKAAKFVPLFHLGVTSFNLHDLKNDCDKTYSALR